MEYTLGIMQVVCVRYIVFYILKQRNRTQMYADLADLR